MLSDDGFARVFRSYSEALTKIDIDVLRRDFEAIVAGSSEVDAPRVSAVDASARSGGLRVFISYRREDTGPLADSLFDRLLASVDGIRVFRDTDTLKPGMVFTEKIEEAIAGCDVLLALVGKKWLDAADRQGRRRIEDEQDWVRLEITTALRQKKHVVPCLVDGAKMPPAAQLPADLAALCSRHAVAISKKNLRRDSEQLVAFLQQFKR